MKAKYTINICLAPGVWSKPIQVTKNQFYEMKKNFSMMQSNIRIEEDDNWKLTYDTIWASGHTDARVVFCKEECKKEK